MSIESIKSSIIRRVLLPLDLWRTGDGARLRYFRELEESQYWTPDQIRALQFSRAKALIEYAWNHCPYYRKLMQSVRFLPSDFRSIEDIVALPVLTKSQLQERRDEMVSANQPKELLILNQTGGSTGEPVSFFLDRQRLALRAAATLRHNSWAGWRVGDKYAALWGAARDLPPKSVKQGIRNRVLDRCVSLDASCITDERFTQFCDRLLRFRPKHILAYAKCISLFARFLRERGLEVCRPESIVTSAETLSDADRELVETTFDCPVFNRYGCREVSVIASECEFHQGLHVCAEHLLVEIGPAVAVNEKNEPLGEIIVTDLMNYAMPLIRYKIGDLAVHSKEICRCGRGLPLIKSVSGRITEFLTGQDGRLVSGVFLATYLVARFPQLGRITINQERPGEVTFRSANVPEETDKKAFCDLATSFLGTGMSISLVSGIEDQTSRSGKFMYCRSKVNGVDGK